MKLNWSVPALTDLENIKAFIAADSEYYALKFVENAFSAVERLAVFPNSGRVVPEIADDSIREIIYGSYRIIYSVAETEIIIVTVIHSMRDFKGL
jgi:plasmid stabilization system protein ParE